VADVEVGKPRMVKIEISPEDLAIAEGYALKGCQNGTICGLMDWDHNLIDQHPDIRKKLKKKRQERKYKLRCAQDDKAMSIDAEGKVEGKDTAMLIFLGKNDLGQSDVIKNEHELGRTVADIFALVAARKVKQIESEVVDAVPALPE
jgi:hypothetical protein